MNKTSTKRVVQYDLRGNRIAAYPSARAASIATGVSPTSISRCCNGKRENGGDFLWTFEGDPLDTSLFHPQVLQYDFIGNFVQAYERPADVEKVYKGSSAEYVFKCLRGQKDYYLNSFWVWDHDKDRIPELVENYGRQIVAVSMDRKETIAYGNIALATEQTGLDRHLITRALNARGSSNGYAWFYMKDREAIENFKKNGPDPAQYKRRERATREFCTTIIDAQGQTETLSDPVKAAERAGVSPRHLHFFARPCTADGFTEYKVIVNGLTLSFSDKNTKAGE